MNCFKIRYLFIVFRKVFNTSLNLWPHDNIQKEDDIVEKLQSGGITAATRKYEMQTEQRIRYCSHYYQ